MTATETAEVNALVDRALALLERTGAGDPERVMLYKQLYAYHDSHPNLEQWAKDDLITAADRLNEGGGDMGPHYAMTGPDSIAGRGDEFESEDGSPLYAGLESYMDDPNKLDPELLHDAAKKLNPLGVGGMKTLLIVVGVAILGVSILYAFWQGALKRATRVGAGGR